MHILEAAMATHIMNRPHRIGGPQPGDPERALPRLGFFCLVRALAGIGGVALFVAILDRAA
jgi:hypothetical protein